MLRENIWFCSIFKRPPEGGTTNCVPRAGVRRKKKPGGVWLGTSPGLVLFWQATLVARVILLMCTLKHIYSIAARGPE